MRIIITGATGFIGQHLLKRLIADGHHIYLLVRAHSNTNDLPPEANLITVPETTSELISEFNKINPNGVIHLASLYLMSHQSDDIDNLIDSNIKFGTKVIDAATKAGVSFFINTNSFLQHYESNPYSPTNLYAATKQAFQDIAQYYAETTNTVVLTLELFNTFGPGDTRPKIFNLWQKAVSSGEEIKMSPGEQIMDITYIDNIIDGYVRAIELATDENAKSHTGRIYTLMSPERMTLKELAKVFIEEVGGELKIDFGAFPYRERETMIPMNKGENLPAWSPKISLREGIKLTFDRKEN